MKRAAAFLFVGYLLGSVTPPSRPAHHPAIPVPSADLSRAYNELRERNAFARRVIDEMRERAGVAERVRLVQCDETVTAFIDRTAIDGVATVAVDPYAIVFAPEPLMRAWLSHEVGHLAAGHLALDWGHPSYEEVQRRELQASAYGLRLAGEDVWRAYFHLLGYSDTETQEHLDELWNIPVRLPPAKSPAARHSP